MPVDKANVFVVGDKLPGSAASVPTTTSETSTLLSDQSTDPAIANTEEADSFNYTEHEQVENVLSPADGYHQIISKTDRCNVIHETDNVTTTTDRVQQTEITMRHPPPRSECPTFNPCYHADTIVSKLAYHDNDTKANQNQTVQSYIEQFSKNLADFGNSKNLSDFGKFKEEEFPSSSLHGDVFSFQGDDPSSRGKRARHGGTENCPQRSNFLQQLAVLKCEALQCSECGVYYANRDSLVQHLGTVHSHVIASYTCLYCSHVFFSKQELLSHIRSVLLSAKPNPTHVQGIIRCSRHTCPICQTVHVSAIMLKSHLLKNTCKAPPLPFQSNDRVGTKLQCMKLILKSYKPKRICYRNSDVLYKPCSHSKTALKTKVELILPAEPVQAMSSEGVRKITVTVAGSRSSPTSSGSVQLTPTSSHSSDQVDYQHHAGVCSVAAATPQQHVTMTPATQQHVTMATSRQQPVTMATHQYYDMDFIYPPLQIQNTYPPSTVPMTTPTVAMPTPAGPITTPCHYATVQVNTTREQGNIVTDNSNIVSNNSNIASPLKQQFACHDCEAKYSSFELLAQHFRENGCHGGNQAEMLDSCRQRY